jgi:hypothetical protein
VVQFAEAGQAFRPRVTPKIRGRHPNWSAGWASEQYSCSATANLVFAVCKDRLLSLSFRHLVKFDKRKSRLLQNCDELACYGKSE